MKVEIKWRLIAKRKRETIFLYKTVNIPQDIIRYIASHLPLNRGAGDDRVSQNSAVRCLILIKLAKHANTLKININILFRLKFNTVLSLLVVKVWGHIGAS